MTFLNWLQDLSFVTWVRESSSLLGYTLYLAGHTIGLVFLVGPNLVIAARVLGLAPDLPLQPLARFRPVMATGLWLTVITGLVLFATDPIHYVANIVFIVKIAAIVVAVVCLRSLTRRLFAGEGTDAQAITPRVRQLTWATVVFWTVAVVAGRLTAYSGVVVLASLGAFFSTLVIATFLIGAFRLLRGRRQPADALSLDVQTSAHGGK